MTTETKKRIEERLEELDRLIEEARGHEKVYLEREYRLLALWEHFEFLCKKDGMVEVW